MTTTSPYNVFWLFGKRTSETKRDFAKKLQNMEAERLGRKYPLWMYISQVPKKGNFFKYHFSDFEKMKKAKKFFNESFFITDKQFGLGLHGPTKKQLEKWQEI
jgi:hypothetical protein